MRNLTVAVPDEVYRQARIKAAEQGRSLSAVVAEYLSSLCESNTEFVRLLAQQDEVLREIESFRGADRIERSRVHDRAIR